MRGTMDWSRLQDAIPFEKNFRWRGGQVSRIEAFADAVFALSVTLLVVSTEVPTSYAQLIEAMRAAPAFALSFALIVMICTRGSERSGMAEDTTSRMFLGINCPWAGFIIAIITEGW